MGRNVAAGMTGGLAYLLDEDDTLIPKVCPRDSFYCPFPILCMKHMPLKFTYTYSLACHSSLLGLLTLLMVVCHQETHKYMS